LLELHAGTQLFARHDFVGTIGRLCEHIACDARGEKRCCAQTQGEKFSLQWNVGVQKIAMKAGSKRALLTRFIFGTKKNGNKKLWNVVCDH
jgi:hypothetical protein